MKPVRAAADWMTEHSADATPHEMANVSPELLGTGMDPDQVYAAQSGAVAGAATGAAETFLSPGNVALMLLSGGTSAAGGRMVNAAAKSKVLAEMLGGSTGPANAAALLKELRAAEQTFGKAKFWNNLGATAESLTGTAMAAHGAPTLYQGIKERDLAKVVSGFFEIGMGALQGVSGRGRFQPGGPPGPGRPRKFFEGGATGDEQLGPFAGLGSEVAPAAAVGGEAAPPGAPVVEAAPVVAQAEPVGGTTGLQLGGAGSAIADNLYQGAWDRLQKTGKASPFETAPAPEAAVEAAFARGEVKSVDDVKRIMQGVADGSYKPPVPKPPHADGYPDIIAPRPFDQPGSDIVQLLGQPSTLPDHIAPSLLPLPTDTIEDPRLRILAEDTAQKWSKESRLGGERSLAHAPELAPHRALVSELAEDIRESRRFGSQQLRSIAREDGKLAGELPDGVWHYEIMPGYTRILQVHQGKVVGVGEALEGKTALIAGGRELGSPVSIRPLYEFMRTKFEPDTVVTTLGELTRRRKIRSYIEEQRKNGPPSAEAAQAQRPGEAGGPPQYNPVGGEVRPALSEGLAAAGGESAGGGGGAEPPSVSGGAGAEAQGPVAPQPGGAAGGTAEEGVGGFAGLGSEAGPGPGQVAGALALDQPPGGPPGAPASTTPPSGEGLPKYAGAINLWRVAETSDGNIARTILETYQAHGQLIAEQQRGTISIREQQEMADQLGLKLRDILKTRPGDTKPAEWLRASHEALVESAGLVWDLAAKQSASPTAEGRAELLRALASHTAVQAHVSGVRSEAGRALGTLAYLSKVERSGDAGHLQALIDEHGGDSQLDLIADLLSKISPEDVRAVSKFASKAIIPTTLDKVYELWLNSILSGPPTHLANVLSNSLLVLTYPAETLIQAGAAHAASAISGKPREVYYGEALHQALAIGRGVREGMTGALQAWKTESPSFGGSKIGELEGPPGAIRGKFGKVVRSFGTRALTAEDEFFKFLINRMALNGRAYSHAVEAQGPKTRSAIAERYAQTLADPPAELTRAAHKEADYRTFNKEPNVIGQAALSIRRKVPGVRWIIPFVRTPVNIVEFGGERLAHPGKLLTFGQAIADYRAGATTTRQLSEEAMHTMVGIGVAIGVGDLVTSGRITGGGPTDPGERRTAALALTGKADYPAYSLKIGDDWYSYARAEPLGITLGMTADFIELSRLNDYTELPARFLAAFRKNFTDKTWVSGVTGLFKAYSDEERYGKAWALRTISSLVPLGGLLTVTARAIDPTRRLPEDLPDAFMAKIPGLTEGAPPALDPFGRVETSSMTAGERMFSPVMRRPTTGDPVAKKLVELDVNIDVPSKKINEEVLKELAVPKLPQEQLFTIRQARGLEVYGRLQGLLGTDGFSTLLPSEQKRLIQHTIADSRSLVSRRARALLLSREPLTLEELTAFPQLGGPPEP